MPKYASSSCNKFEMEGFLQNAQKTFMILERSNGDSKALIRWQIHAPITPLKHGREYYSLHSPS